MALKYQSESDSSHSTLVAVVLLVVCIVLFALYVREGSTGQLHSLQNSTLGATAPVQSVGSQVGATFDLASSSISDATADSATLSELEEQNAELRELVAQAEEYRLEAERLQSLLNLADAYNISGVSARVIGRSGEAWNQTITINVGTSSGVDAGQTVMGTSGVIGQVVSTTSTSAIVRLISDPQSGVAAIIQSNRAEGIVSGSLDSTLYLEGVDADVTVQVGDVVLTSGLGGSYTRGLIIGTVVKVDMSQGESLRRIVVSANDTADNMQEVIVVMGVDNTSATKTGISLSNTSTTSNTSSGDNALSNTASNTENASNTAGDANE